MQYPEMTFRIEMFGNLVEELKYWHTCLTVEESDDSFEYCEERFTDSLEACREMRELLIQELDLYVEECNRDGTPVDLGYWRVRKQLLETEF